MKKKVLFFIEDLSGGGAEQVLVTLLRHFDYENYDVTLLTVSDGGVHLDEVDYTKVHYKTIIPKHKGALADFWYAVKYKLLYQYLPAWLVAKLVIPSGYDTYVAFIEGYCTKIIGQLPSSCKKVAYVHVDLKTRPWTLQSHIYRTLQEEMDVYKRFDKIVCVSYSVEDVMRSYYGLTNTTTIHNPFDVAHINRQAREHVDFKPAEGFNIVSVGRLVEQKGFDLLIPIIARLHDEGLNINLYILGKGVEYEKLKSLSSQLSALSYIHFLGYQNNPHAIVSKMDLYVCSSRTEGYSLVIGEAITLGLPIVSTRCAGQEELFADSGCGILCDDYDQLYENIKNVVLNPELREELHQKSLKHAKTLGVDNIMKQVYSVI